MANARPPAAASGEAQDSACSPPRVHKPWGSGPGGPAVPALLAGHPPSTAEGRKVTPTFLSALLQPLDQQTRPLTTACCRQGRVGKAMSQRRALPPPPPGGANALHHLRGSRRAWRGPNPAPEDRKACRRKPGGSQGPGDGQGAGRGSGGTSQGHRQRHAQGARALVHSKNGGVPIKEWLPHSHVSRLEGVQEPVQPPRRLTWGHAQHSGPSFNPRPGARSCSGAGAKPRGLPGAWPLGWEGLHMLGGLLGLTPT